MTTRELLASLTATIHSGNLDRGVKYALQDALEIVEMVDSHLEAEEDKAEQEVFGKDDLPFDPDYVLAPKCERCGLTEKEAEGSACVAQEWRHGSASEIVDYPTHAFVAVTV